MLNWNQTPVVTSVELVPVTKSIFPAVTLCPHGIDRPAVMDRLLKKANYSGLKEQVASMPRFLDLVYLVADQNAKLRFHESVCGHLCSDEFDTERDLPVFARTKLITMAEDVDKTCHLGIDNVTTHIIPGYIDLDIRNYTSALLINHMDGLFLGNRSVYNACQHLNYFLANLTV